MKEILSFRAAGARQEHSGVGVIGFHTGREAGGARSGMSMGGEGVYKLLLEVIHVSLHFKLH